MPTSSALSKVKSPRKGRAKASASATLAEPKPHPVKRKAGGGRKPGAKAWNVAEFLRLFWLIADRCPCIASDWISLAEQHSAEQEANRSHKACQDKWGFVLKVKKPTGGREPHPLYTLAHAVNDHLNKVHGTVTLNDDPSILEAELKESIEDVFDIARSQLEGLEDTIPAFDKDFEPLERPTEEADEDDKDGTDGADSKGSKDDMDGEGGEDSEDGEDGGDDGMDRIELFPGAEIQGESMEYRPGEAPDGAEILEAVYQPPTPEPAPEARDSPDWDIEDEQPPAESLAPPTPAQARPKMVSPNKSQPGIFNHLASSSSTSHASAGSSMPPKAPRPTATTPFPFSKTNSTGATKSRPTPATASKTKSESNSVASGSKAGISTKIAQSPAVKKRKSDGLNEAQLEYIVPKHSIGGKLDTKGTKRPSNTTKANEPPAKKKSTGKEREEILDISTDDEYLDRFVDKKEASNFATIAIMDGKREIHLVREQLADAHKTIEELREKIRDHKVEKRVQERLQAMGATRSTSATSTAPTEITDLQFRNLLAQYLQNNNLSIVDNWDATPFADSTHPFTRSHSDDFESVP
ncbi:hypothetical protein BN14_05999 [Rhizoctonia solani AG-1 IB]|uniref:Myb-like domain-containing protein n=1 Tax=Thanatephorus cucumeris (strain AG1-IB / isolate 7/3/14) TaxID=1108050 RepID=M5C7W9_THACB|nr:hypothetical protein BN14_05999 [Rhizoctonia solani AG-1 IB]